NRRAARSAAGRSSAVACAPPGSACWRGPAQPRWGSALNVRSWAASPRLVGRGSEGRGGERPAIRLAQARERGCARLDGLDRLIELEVLALKLLIGHGGVRGPATARILDQGDDALNPDLDLGER